MGPLEKKIKEKLTKALDPVELEIVNESELHAGHSGNPGGAETHFKISIVCSKFNDMSTMDKHKMVYQILSQEIPQIHAVSLKLKGLK